MWGRFKWCKQNDFQREYKSVATATKALKWKTNSNVLRCGLSDRNICIKNRVETESITHNIKLGGTLDPSEKKNCTSMNWSWRQYSLQFNHCPNTKRTFIFTKNRTTQQLLLFWTKWGGGGQLRITITNNKADLASVFIMITVEHLPGIQNVQAVLESRQKGNTSNLMLNKGIFKQINKM